MNKLVQQVMEELEKLPEDEQNAIATRVLAQLQVENTEKNSQLATFNRNDLGSKPSGRSRWDISVYNRENQLILIVEVKRRSRINILR
ncbi:hypothetical protein NO108_01996 [Planktothrix rubescens]|nr:hypothetical protein NO108_01996 [Planktothrix rubescens]